MSPSIELHIEELVLTGIPARDADRLGQALQEQLALLLRQGLPPALAKGAELPALQAGNIDLSRHQSPESLGYGVAGSVFAGFKQARYDQ